MDTPVDLLNDPLAQAALSPQERDVWEQTRTELIIAREQLKSCEERVKVLERPTREDGFIQTVLSRPDFNREVARMLAFNERYGGVASVLYFDVENLSGVITQNGHSTGDAVVRAISDTLAKYIRSSDILGRLATNEFGVLLSHCDNVSAWKKGESLADMLYTAFSAIKGLSVDPAVSYGAYTFQEKEDVTTGLKRVAEKTVARTPKSGPSP